MSGRVKTEADTEERERTRGQFAKKLKNGMLRFGLFFTDMGSRDDLKNQNP